MLNYKEIYQKEHIENRLTYSQIREKYNIPRGTWDYWVRKKLKLKNDHRKHRANDSFFSNIDTEEKAYLLGFLYADGYLANDGRMGCRLTEDDIEIIKLIQKYIAIESPIEYTNNQNIKRRPQVSIRWKSEQMYNDLLHLGFCIDKTHTDSFVFQYIPENLKVHFLRGYCDGDGNVRFSLVKNEKWYKCAINFSNGSRQILDDIQNWLHVKYNCSGILYANKTYYLLRYEKALDAAIIARELYSNATIYLTRKYNSALQMINYRTNTELTGKNKKFLVV
jgi:hypothetical protein